MTAREYYAAWTAAVDADMAAELNAIRNDDAEIRERFGRELAFGTGGLRGILGAGTNRMNIYVVRRVTRSLAAWLRKKGAPCCVAVAYDSRINSRLFADEAAKTLAACGVDVWIYPRLEPTPALSWAVRELGCGAGVMITASHNPAEYNGYKVYGADGCQITDTAAKEISDEIQTLGYFDNLPAVEAGTVRQIPEHILDRFVDTETAQISESLENIRVVYTPLNGTGLECVKRSLRRAGVSELVVVPEQEQPDGRFPTCPKPNPEYKEAMALGLQLSVLHRPDLLLATDPDCDRVGVAVPDGKQYRLLSGNELGVLLFDYICRTRTEQGTMPSRPVAITTIVSTDMASAIARQYGVELRRTLTGFKYIGEQIGRLEDEGEADRFLFGFEESCGYLTGIHVRDKDAVNACLAVCAMTSYYKRKGKTLLQVLDALTGRHGSYFELLKTFDFPGERGFAEMRGIMERLRRKPPDAIAGIKVIEVMDYTNPEGTLLPPADVLEFRLENCDRVTIRPSGTEPKIKMYLFARRAVRAESEEGAAVLMHAMEQSLRGQMNEERSAR